MNLPKSLLWWHASAVRPAHRPAAPAWVNATLDAAQAAPADMVRCCGWFDSSHELNVGMQVTEHLTPASVANEVPLGWWLDWAARADAPTANGGALLREFASTGAALGAGLRRAG